MNNGEADRQFPSKPTHGKQRSWRTLTGGKTMSPSSEMNSQSICLEADLVRPAAIPQTSTSTSHDLCPRPWEVLLWASPLTSSMHQAQSLTSSLTCSDILIDFVCVHWSVWAVAQIKICLDLRRVTVDVFLPFRAWNWEWAGINNSPTNRLARLHVHER